MFFTMLRDKIKDDQVRSDVLSHGSGYFVIALVIVLRLSRLRTEVEFA